MPRLLWAALAVVLVVCVGVGAALQLDRIGKGTPGAAAPTVEPEKRAPVVFALGDSYTVGIRGIKPEGAYAAETARTLGWQIVVAGQARTGFANDGGTGETFSSLFGQQLAWRPAPDMMLVSGGHNDVRMRPEAITQRARALLEGVRKRWPRTQLVLMGPMWGGDPGPKALMVRDALRDVAAILRIPFIDPLSGKWITGDVRRGTGNAARLIRRDGTHPNQAGNRHIARRLADDLRALKLAEPVLGKTNVGYNQPDPSVEALPTDSSTRRAARERP
ncbi:SGNH/GDSL hydrolase family protein [Spirillospora sp. NPDC029432]|uniref:SGNH/GDSL hydrolase family protein n=1 Tax=Spirillospora sp. NPDC029432 TaxID=3154599 RepID=UPI0034540092